MSTADVQILGIDPAPSKRTVVWSQDGAEAIEATKVRDFVEVRLNGSAVLIAWDAPLSFDAVNGFSDRPIDRAVRSWVAQNVKQNNIDSAAVSVLPFAGCSHWAISCHVLGFPFGRRLDGLELSPATYRPPLPGRGFVVEVHPAVALAVLWIERQLDKPFPRYKGGKEFRGKPAFIAERLGFPLFQGISDDTLDAYMAWWLADQFTRGKAIFVGDPQSGGYLLPGGSIADQLRELESERRVQNVHAAEARPSGSSST